MSFSSRTRYLALQRALKMHILFKEPTFDNIVTALNMPSATQPQHAARQAAFYAALPASLVQAEKDWLWNYLQRCTETGYGGWGIKPVGGPNWLPDDCAFTGW